MSKGKLRGGELFAAHGSRLFSNNLTKPVQAVRRSDFNRGLWGFVN